MWNQMKVMALLGLWSALAACPVAAAEAAGALNEPTLTVTGHGESYATPDLAVVRVGATAQADEAAAAQASVNKVVQATVARLKAIGIDAKQLSTATVTLSPMYSGQEPRRPGEAPPPPHVVGYQASNSIRVEVTDIQRVGEVIDAAVKAGANQIEGVSFELKDQGAARASALQRAVSDAEMKAKVIAEAMRVRLDTVAEVNEGGVQPIYPQPQMRTMLAQDVGSPIEPGQVRVNATVTVRYRIAPLQT